MDLSMPIMDGLEATRAILEEFPKARIVVLTTYAGDEDIHRALDAGAMGYLLKDMLAVDVLKVVRSVMMGQESPRRWPQPSRNTRRASASRRARRR